MRPSFPKYLDKNRMFGPFEIDEAVFIVLGVGVSLLVGFILEINVAIAMIIGILLGFIGAFSMIAVKKKYADGFALHLLYRKGIRHPIYDNPIIKAKHPKYSNNEVKLMPNGFLKTLVE